MNNSKVLIVISKYPPDFTGAGIRAHRQALILKRRYGREFEVLTFDTQNNKEKKSYNRTIDGISVNVIPLPHKRKLNAYAWQPFLISIIFFRLLKFFLKKERVKIIHGFSVGWPVINTLLIGKAFGAKTIVEQTLLDSDDATTLIKRNWVHFFIIGWFKFIVLRFIVDKIVCISPILRKRARRMGIPGYKIWVRPNPVDPDCFYPVSKSKKIKIRSELNLPENEIILLNVGRISKRKNQRLLTESIQFLEHDEKVTLLLIGPLLDRDLNYYKEILALKNHFPENIHLIVIPKLQNNICQFMQASDIFLFSSKKEGFGNVLVEALMSGLPVVMLSLPSISEMILWDKQCGVAIDTDDPKAFARIVKNQIDRLNFEKTPFYLHRETKKRFEVSKIIHQYESIYRNFDRKF